MRIVSSLPLFLAIAPLMGANEPRFEAASVKRAEQCSMETSVDPGRVTLIGVPMQVILKEAFSVNLDQIVGPSWLDDDCYAIVAKIPEGSTRDQVPAMLQALLVERFKLLAHQESRLHPGYALLVDKNGPKLKESSIRSSRFAGSGVRFIAAPEASGIKGSMSIKSLARILGSRLNSPVEDLTGLEGTYDIDVTWTPDPAFEKPGLFAQDAARVSASGDMATASVPTGMGNIFAAMRESLGLRLEPRKEQIEVVVIDHTERVPVEN